MINYKESNKRPNNVGAKLWNLPKHVVKLLIVIMKGSCMIQRMLNFWDNLDGRNITGDPNEPPMPSLKKQLFKLFGGLAIWLILLWTVFNHGATMVLLWFAVWIIYMITTTLIFKKKLDQNVRDFQEFLNNRRA